MGAVKTESGQALGHFEPSMTATLLPRCAGCSLPHPLVRGFDSNICPDCGVSTPVGQTVTARAHISGFAPWKFLARFFLWAGEVLANLARSL